MNSIRTILFPTDFSDASNQVFPYAASLAKAFGATLILMHVVGSGKDDGRSAAGLEEAAKMNGIAETVRVKMKDKLPSHHIIELAKERQCDLIVMATQGRAAFLQFFLGASTAEEVVRGSSVPVLIVKTDADEPATPFTGRLKEILFPTDLSQVSESAFTIAATFAKKFDARLFVLHVIDEDSVKFYHPAESSDDGRLKERVYEFVKSHMASLPGADAITSIHILEGNAESAILEFASENGVDVIAMATHGHTGIREDLLGSTTDRIIRQSRCPVLALRGTWA
jgi:nucleotide-binding universal stress UspA family protein